MGVTLTHLMNTVYSNLPSQPDEDRRLFLSLPRSCVDNQIQLSYICHPITKLDVMFTAIGCFRASHYDGTGIYILAIPPLVGGRGGGNFSQIEKQGKNLKKSVMKVQKKQGSISTGGRNNFSGWPEYIY